MQFKLGVHYKRDGALLIIKTADRIYSDMGKDLVVTSLMDGKHMEGSKHYIGDAVDLRTFYFSKKQLEVVVRRLKNTLGNDYDVVLESDHIHVEYDPK